MTALRIGACAAAFACAACLPTPDRSGDPDVAEPSAALKIDVVADGLAHPWSLAFLPGGDMLVTERDGRLRLIEDGALVPDPVATVPDLYVDGQGGLFEVALDPDFPRNRRIFLSYAAGDAGANATRLARATLLDRSIADFEVIFTATPWKDTHSHFGGRIAFLPDGTLLMPVGEGFAYREEAQRLSSHLGSVVRLDVDGNAPADNPFVGRDDALPETWSYGHRNPQAIVYDGATGRVWENEHGPRGGDEVNLIAPGANYGWPIATYGVDYDYARISPFTEAEGLTPPATHWVPSIAPSGMAIYHGALFPQWEGDLLVTALAAREMRRLDLDADGNVIGQEALLADRETRLRDVRVGPDGAVYVLTDDDPGQILRLTPAD